MLTKDSCQHYWIDETSLYKAKVYMSEDNDEVLVKVRWQDDDVQRQIIFPVHPITTYREMARQAIDIVIDRQKLARRKKLTT